VRYCFDFGRYRTEDPAKLHDDEWKMSGGAENADAIIVASEPLTKDTSSRVELPEHGALFAEVRRGRPHIAVRLLD
jgi:glutamine amidotransferase